MDTIRAVGLLLWSVAAIYNLWEWVMHIASAGEEVSKRRENGGGDTRYSGYGGYYLRAVVLGTNVSALLCAIIHVVGEL